MVMAVVVVVVVTAAAVAAADFSLATETTCAHKPPSSVQCIQRVKPCRQPASPSSSSSSSSSSSAETLADNSVSEGHDLETTTQAAVQEFRRLTRRPRETIVASANDDLGLWRTRQLLKADGLLGDGTAPPMVPPNYKLVEMSSRERKMHRTQALNERTVDEEIRLSPFETDDEKRPTAQRSSVGDVLANAPTLKDRLAYLFVSPFIRRSPRRNDVSSPNGIDAASAEREISNLEKQIRELEALVVETARPSRLDGVRTHRSNGVEGKVVDEKKSASTKEKLGVKRAASSVRDFTNLVDVLTPMRTPTTRVGTTREVATTSTSTSTTTTSAATVTTQTIRAVPTTQSLDYGNDDDDELAVQRIDLPMSFDYGTARSSSSSSAPPSTTTTYNPRHFYHTVKPPSKFQRETVLTFCTKESALRDSSDLVIACGSETEEWTPPRCPQESACFWAPDATYRICCPVSKIG